jgi:hypothetical protein
MAWGYELNIVWAGWYHCIKVAWDDIYWKVLVNGYQSGVIREAFLEHMSNDNLLS